MIGRRTVAVALILLCGSLDVLLCLDNGLARTPPMGWLTWERFRCNTDCDNDPDNCISERLIKQMADHMVKDGFLAAGYDYITVDDCWPLHERGTDGKIVPDTKRFPSGIKALADYVHKLGLKFGIYGDFGTKTCGGYPGSLYYLELDAVTFADWGVDLLKLDGCYCDPKDFDTGYPAMGKWLNSTGRPILYSCSWPAYQVDSGIKPDYDSIARHCNIWRNYDDIQDSWSSVATIINFYAKDQYNFSGVAGPGNFNDPDMLIIGNFGLSHDQERAQMAIWCILAAPLIMSNDLRNLRESSKAILTNPRLLAVNQDSLGIQGKVIKTAGHIQVWRKPILPKGSFAVAVLNLGDDGTPSRQEFTLMELTDSKQNFNLTEVFDGKRMGVFKPSDKLKFDVNPSGVYMFTATLASRVEPLRLKFNASSNSRFDRL